VLELVFEFAGGLVLGYLAGHFRPAARHAAFQNRGESLVTEALRREFGTPAYHLMNHVTLRLEDGSTQVDHILVSRFGVYVVETKHLKGWIFGDASDAKWTQVLFKARFRFQNPILQNRRHVRAVEKRLDFLPPGAIRSAVVFTGDAEFKTAVPPGVFNLSGFIGHLRAQETEVMSQNRVQFCVGRLETERLAISGVTDVEHIESVASRHRGQA
jgi:hypothetical protein